MLRITTMTDHPRGQTLKVEGKLLGPWVGELLRACAQPPETVGSLCLDLSAVSFVDPAGVKLLRELLGRGIILAACSGLIAELLHVEGR